MLSEYAGVVCRSPHISGNVTRGLTLVISGCATPGQAGDERIRLPAPFY